MPGIELVDRVLRVDGSVLLTDVQKETVQLTPAQSGRGAFIGAVASKASDRHVITLGTLRDVRFTSCFRFKMWWQTQRMGDKGSDVASETQFMLLELPSTGKELKYAVILPLIDGPFRASLQGSANDELQLVCETGSPSVQGSEIAAGAYIHFGTNPFETITEAVRAAEARMQTFKRREEKKMPGFVDYFGWCTWDAFYTRVDPEGIKHGLKTLGEAGAPPRFLIIDDGWQSVTRGELASSSASSPPKGGGAKVAPEDSYVEADPAVGQQADCRVFSVEENSKFKGKTTLKDFISEMKSQHGLKYVLMWHALFGYWGGVLPGKYGAAMKKAYISPTVLANQDDGVYHDMTGKGAGIMDAAGAAAFFNDEHKYLAAAGVDGVKVDVQSAIEAYAPELGGRVALSAAYQNALGSSTEAAFPDNAVIACMSHGSDAIFHTQRVAVVRVSEDYWPRDPLSHTIHMASCAYNSLFMGEIMQPDWDMFQSKHPAAAYHAAARAVSGGPIYVSDKPGEHDPSILRKLVLPDGRVLRPKLPARPTRDCLLVDPARDVKTALKVWSLNSCGGVIGAFNCQGAGWDRTKRENVQHDEESKAVDGCIRADDVEGLAAIAGDGWDGAVAVYSHCAGVLEILSQGASKAIHLPAKQFEIFTVAPLQQLASVTFAAIGLVNLYNSGGAVLSIGTESEGGKGDKVIMKVVGQGKLAVYASKQPAACSANNQSCKLDYDSNRGMLYVDLEWDAQGSVVELQF